MKPLVCCFVFAGLACLQSVSMAQTTVTITPSPPLPNAGFGINVQGVSVGGPLTITTDVPHVGDGVIDIIAHILHGTGSTAPAPYSVNFVVPGVAAGQYTVRYYSYNALNAVQSPVLESSTHLIVGPQPGLWWNPSESGTGYSFDVKHGVLVATIYSYTPGGPPIWYLAFGPIDSNNTVTGTLFKYANGQCISCTYTAPTDNGNDGTMIIQFTSPTSATMTLPGRAPFMIVPQDF